VAGKQANDVLAALVNHHHRRVAELVIHQRGQHAYRDPGGADENQRRIAAEGLARGAGKTVFKGRNPSSSSFSLVKQVNGSIAASRFASRTPPGSGRKARLIQALRYSWLKSAA
jgi:hypothetical protein